MFFGIVNHDIRTPLNAILGYAELLRGGVGSQAEMYEALDSIRASGTTLLQLVNDVLDLEKMDVGKMTLCPEPMRLSRLVDDVFASFRLAASEKGIELVDRVADVPVVLLDEHRFRQILFNLIGNAVKFTSRGFVTVSASYTGTKLEVSVSDTGCGIPPDMLGRAITAAGYAFSVATFSLDENDKLSFLNDELLRATDLVIAAHAPRNVQKCLAESGLNHIFVYGERPECSDRPWIRLAPETAISHFAEHCEKAGVTQVTQVRFEGRSREMVDAEAALAEKGIKSSWMTIPRGDVDKIRFNDAASCACEAFATMPRGQINGVFLFWNSFITQGAIMAVLAVPGTLYWMRNISSSFALEPHAAFVPEFSEHSQPGMLGREMIPSKGSRGSSGRATSGKSFMPTCRTPSRCWRSALAATYTRYTLRHIACALADGGSCRRRSCRSSIRPAASWRQTRQ